MILLVILILVLIYGIYTLIAELVCHIWHVGTFYKGISNRRSIALTFDDGPDIRYTPEVLRILKAHGAKVTFFLVGDHAVNAPELIQAMVADGHEVALHGQQHVHAWFLHPIATWRNIAEGKRTLETLSGTRVQSYRPPWGAFNWMTRISAKLLGLRPVLWSVRAMDWYAGDYVDEVVQRVVKGAHPGAIVLCHDAGGTEGAPVNTVTALPQILTRLQSLGYSFETVAEMVQHKAAYKIRVRSMLSSYPWFRKRLIQFWYIVELTIARLYHIQPVNEMFRVSPANWHHGERVDETGRPVMMNGWAALDLHIQNETVITLSTPNDNRGLVKALRLTKNGFRDLARMLQYDERYASVHVVMAVTLMNRGMEMLGFHVEELPNNSEKRRLQRYMQFLMGFYHPEGFKRLKYGRQALELRLIWMSREEMLTRYGHAGAAVHDRAE